MTHLITGGSGYLGVAIARQLRRRAIPVRIHDLVRSPRLPGDTEFVRGDIRDYDRVRAVMEGCVAVHHLVGIMPQARAPEETMQAVNVGGTENVLRAAAERGVKRVVFVSSSEVYGRPKRIPIREEHPLEPIGEYGRNKVEAERLCDEYRKRARIETVILRPPTIVGPEMAEPTFLRNLEMARKGRFFCVGSGNHRFQMAFVNDVAEACILAAEKSGIDGEIFNIGAEGTLPFKKQLEEISRYLGKETRVRSVPCGLFKILMKILHPLGLSPLEPDHIHLLYSDFVMDVGRAKEKLGWVPTRTDLQMLTETYEWYVSAH